MPDQNNVSLDRDQLLDKYEPVLIFARDERFFPTSVEEYLAKSHIFFKKKILGGLGYKKSPKSPIANAESSLEDKMEAFRRERRKGSPRWEDTIPYLQQITSEDKKKFGTATDLRIFKAFTSIWMVLILVGLVVEVVVGLRTGNLLADLPYMAWIAEWPLIITAGLILLLVSCIWSVGIIVFPRPEPEESRATLITIFAQTSLSRLNAERISFELQTVFFLFLAATISALVQTRRIVSDRRAIITLPILVAGYAAIYHFAQSHHVRTDPRRSRAERSIWNRLTSVRHILALQFGMALFMLFFLLNLTLDIPLIFSYLLLGFMTLVTLFMAFDVTYTKAPNNPSQQLVRFFYLLLFAGIEIAIFLILRLMRADFTFVFIVLTLINIRAGLLFMMDTVTAQEPSSRARRELVNPIRSLVPKPTLKLLPGFVFIAIVVSGTILTLVVNGTTNWRPVVGWLLIGFVFFPFFVDTSRLREQGDAVPDGSPTAATKRLVALLKFTRYLFLFLFVAQFLLARRVTESLWPQFVNVQHILILLLSNFIATSFIYHLIQAFRRRFLNLNGLLALVSGFYDFAGNIFYDKYPPVWHEDEESKHRFPYYARVYDQEQFTGDAGKYVVLQYWYFYPFNDWRTRYNGMNDHEGDWEHVDVFLKRAEEDRNQFVPVYVLYSQHILPGPFLRRSWQDPHLMKVAENGEGEKTHPVVFVGAGSHANYYRRGRHPLHEMLRASRMVEGLYGTALRASSYHENRAEILLLPSDLDREIRMEFELYQDQFDYNQMIFYRTQPDKNGHYLETHDIESFAQGTDVLTAAIFVQRPEQNEPSQGTAPSVTGIGVTAEQLVDEIIMWYQNHHPTNVQIDVSNFEVIEFLNNDEFARKLDQRLWSSVESPVLVDLAAIEPLEILEFRDNGNSIRDLQESKYRLRIGRVPESDAIIENDRYFRTHKWQRYDLTPELDKDRLDIAWLEYDGRWGYHTPYEGEAAPTGPSMNLEVKDAWKDPIKYAGLD